MRNFPRKSSETTRAARSSKSYERNQRDHNEVFNESSRRNHKERGGGSGLQVRELFERLFDIAD